MGLTAAAARRSRRLRLVEALDSAALGAIVITRRTDIAWLTGFTGTAGAVLVRDDGRTIVATDDRYAERVRDTVPDVEVVSSRMPLRGLLSGEELGSTRAVGLDGDDVSWVDWKAAVEVVGQQVTLHHFGTLLTGLRATKDSVEIEALRRACEITDAAVSSVLPQMQVGVSERDIARAFLRAIEAGGADGPSFPPIVASGPNAAAPHHEPGSRALMQGDVVVVDVGARVDGYCADMTRTFSIGEPVEQLLTAHDVVERAQAAGRLAARVGASAGAVDEAARAVIEDAGLGAAFTHGTGHGVGLDIHEPPILMRGAAGILGESFTVTVEPGIYLPGVGGVRIEDTVVVGTTRAESLTRLPRDLVVL